MNNKFIIDNKINLDYEMINQLLRAQLNLEYLEFNDVVIDVDIVNYIIKDTNVKKIILNNSTITHSTNELINIEELVLNNIICDNLEILSKFKNIKKLDLNNYREPFDCYYLRRLENLYELNISYSNLFHLGGLGYLNQLEILSLYSINITNWLFLTKIPNLKTLYLDQDININEIPLIMLDVKIKKNN